MPTPKTKKNYFHKYNSITNTYSDKFLRKVKEEGNALPAIKYEVTEKIHGANFVIYITDNQDTPNIPDI